MLHIQSFWAADDGEYLYATILFSSSIYDSAGAELFIDADSVNETGSGSKPWRGLPIGAELYYYYNHP